MKPNTNFFSLLLLLTIFATFASAYSPPCCNVNSDCPAGQLCDRTSECPCIHKCAE